MNWYYVENGQQVGPVTREQLEQLLQSGRITIETLVWQQGMDNWLPLRDANVTSMTPPSAPPTLASLNLAQPVCVECGRSFPADELVTLNKSRVCAGCKPVFLQRMAEGVANYGGAGLYRTGKKIFTTSETPFPDRCVKCNAPANGFRHKQTLYWAHPAYLLLILCNLLVLLVVYMIVRKKAVFSIGLCEVHRKQRLVAITACVTGLILGVVLICVGIGVSMGWLIGVGALLMVAGTIWGVARGRLLAATKIDKQDVWLTGAGKAFLDSLPDRPG